VKARRIVTRYEEIVCEEPLSLAYGVGVREGRTASELFARIIGEETVEVFGALMLDAKHRVRGYAEISRGTLSSSIVHPREVFGPAIRLGAAAILVGHNHPSGDPKPSQNDLAVTERLAAAGVLLGIPLMDHVIIGHDRHTYLRLEHQALFLDRKRGPEETLDKALDGLLSPADAARAHAADQHGSAVVEYLNGDFPPQEVREPGAPWRFPACAPPVWVVEVDGVHAAHNEAGRFLTFRAPHHSCSRAGIAGELRLAVGGVLYLDEAGEFRRQCVAEIRGGIENGGPMPAAVLVDTGTGNLSGEAKRSYARRVAAIVAELREACELRTHRTCLALGGGRWTP
jgi:DNA repair protein RadC